MVEDYDWAKVYALLEAGREPCFECSHAQTRVFWAWAKRHHNKSIYYKSVADGVVQFKLKSQRQGAGNRPKEKRHDGQDQGN